MPKGTGKADGSNTDAAVDLEVLRRVTEGDRDLMQELAELYLGDCDLQLRALDDALENRDLDRIRRIGHSLHGASSSVGAHGVLQVFRQLEDLARAGRLEDLPAAIEAARSRFEAVRKALDELR